MMEALKCVPKLVHDVSDSVILLQVSFGHEMAGILYSSHVCAVSKWACFPTHTSNHAMSHLLCLKNKNFVLKLYVVLFLIVGMSPPTSNYSRLWCFSKINKSFFHSFYCFCIPRKNPRAPITKERSRVAGTGYVRGFRSNNQSKVRLRLCTVLEQLLAANPQISEAPKNVSLLMQKIQKRVQMARIVLIKFAQQIVMVRFSACAVPHVSSEKETWSKSLHRRRQRKSI